MLLLTIFFKDKQIDDLSRRLRQGFASQDGVLVKALDSALASFNVQRQTYYGGTFVGNHVHRYLKVCILSAYELKGICLPNSVPSHFKPDNSEKLCSAVTDVAQQHAPTLLPAAQMVADKFRRVFSLFGACHTIQRNCWKRPQLMT